MSLSKLITRVTLLLVCGVFFAAAAQAQFKASIQGTVLDSNGGVVAGAKVTVTNQDTGVVRDTVASAEGFYRVSELPPGRYTVSVEAAGFKISLSKDVVVEAEQPRGLDITLAVGNVQESVTVTASAGGLQTENASTTNTISSQEVLTLPQFGRDPYELIRLTPGVFGDASRQGNGNSFALPQQVGPGGSNSQIFQTENQVQVSSNGQRVTANTFTIDGVSVDSLSNGGAAVITPNQESVQEIVVTSASFNAEQGRNSGAQVQVISKGGTNNYHGSGLIKFNDKGLNAFNKFYGPNTGTLPTLSCESGAFTVVASHCPTRNDQKYRDFGGSLGGPILRDKLFFFFSYDGLRQSNTIAKRDVTLETPAFEKYVIQVNPNSLAAKIFSTPGIAPRISTTTKEVDCCSLVTNPSDPNFRQLGQWYTAGNTPKVGQAPGNGPDGTTDWGIYDLTIPNSSVGNQYNGRVDYTRGKDQFFFSSYFVWLNNINGGDRPIDDITFQPHNRVAAVGWTRILSNVLVNEARFNFTRFAFDQLQPLGQTNFGIPQIRIFDFDIGGFGSQDTFLGIPVAGTTPAKFAQNTFAFKDTINWVHRSHAFKFGVDITREQNNDNESGAERPNYQFRGLLNFANDACCFDEKVAVDGKTGGLPNGQRYFRTAAYSLFVQDDWKLRPNLTVNLGLRWEYFPPVTEAKSILSNYIFGTQGFINGSVKVVSQLYNADKNNFGPRIGFAYSPNIWGHKTVLRAGFGILYNRPFGSLFSNARQNTPYFAQAESCCFFDPGPIVGPPPGSSGPCRTSPRPMFTFPRSKRSSSFSRTFR